MDSQELARRLLEIARGSSSIPITEKIERTCWLDGEECPYGRPEGQFLKRPRADCKLKTEKIFGCSRLDDISDELYDLVSQALIEETEEEVAEKVRKATTKVSGELSALADQAEDDQVKKVLKLAAELIEKEEDGLVNREIVLLEDLDIEE